MYVYQMYLMRYLRKIEFGEYCAQATEEFAICKASEDVHYCEILE